MRVDKIMAEFRCSVDHTLVFRDGTPDSRVRRERNSEPIKNEMMATTRTNERV